MRFGSLYKSRDALDALAQVRAWTRARFGLGQDATLFATEIRCAQPGCPPLETVVVFWRGDATRYRFKVFKPACEVNEDDIPVTWLLPALVDDGRGDDCC